MLLSTLVRLQSSACRFIVPKVSSNYSKLLSWGPPSLFLSSTTKRWHLHRGTHTVSIASTLSSKMPDKKEFQRLSQDVIPKNYALTLQPDLKAFTFEGKEDITIEVTKATKTVTLNSADIVVKEVSYKGDDQTFKEVQITYSTEDETVTFAFPEEVKVGKGNLSLSFTGELNDKMKGFYRNKYTGPDGVERYGATTQFEATDARRSFPCWDEPAIKATFDVTLVVPKDRVALSNMPIVKEEAFESDANLKVVKYDRTPIMSTYLLAYVIGEYDYVEDTDSDGVKVRVYTPVGKKEQGQFALEVAVKTLPFYKEYFDIAYPLPKMDLIAITDFAAGAMENWGLVTYRETALLIDPENSSSAAKQWVALVVGHEIAHQWFGNLVTMEWWTHLWLNEGFASWIEYLCVDNFFPDYDIWTQFASTDFSKALDLDALKNSHPIEVPVGHPAEIDEIFDAISYSKGASVIRMLHNWIGDEDFKKGMHEYLTDFKYKNARTEALWAALGKASGKPVDKVMSTWTKQMGFPVIKVSQVIEGTTRKLTISQEKFCADGCVGENSSTWLVPISFSTASSPDQPIKFVVLDGKSTEVELTDIKEGDWVKVNTGSVGFYRTQYTSEMLETLIPGIRDQSLPPRDRLGLQNDLFALARAGLTSAVDVLKVVQAFENETNYTVWSDLASNLASVGLCLQYTDFYDLFKAFGRSVFGGVAAKLGWDKKEGEGHLDAMLRTLVLGRMGRYGDEAVIAEAKKRFQAHVDKTAILPADLRSPVYGTVLSAGDEETFETMLKLSREADLHEEKLRIMRSLGAVKDEKLIRRVLDFALTDEVRSQDTVFVIASVTGSVAGRVQAWAFLREKWTELHTRYKGGFLLARLVMNTTENFVTEELAKEIEAFFQSNPAPAAERTIQQSLENIRLNAKWLERETEPVREYLKSLN